VLSTVEGKPNQIYYFHYQRANMLLDGTALKIAAWIQARGSEAFPVPASQVVDWERQLGTVSHREVARLAGHGWYGRNNLMVNRPFGSGVRYATVLTDLPLELDAPVRDSCGACRACIAACPASAITEQGFDLSRCREKLKEFVKTEKIGQMICGVCVRACRPSRDASPR
jgi:epoxyqueuosine reductase QueG